MTLSAISKCLLLRFITNFLLNLQVMQKIALVAFILEADDPNPKPKPMFQSPQHCPMEAPHPPSGPRSGHLQLKKLLQDVTECKVAPPPTKHLTFTFRTEFPPTSKMAHDLVVRPISMTANI